MQSSSREDEAEVKQGRKKVDEPVVMQWCSVPDGAVMMQQWGDQAVENPELDRPGQNKEGAAKAHGQHQRETTYGLPWTGASSADQAAGAAALRTGSTGKCGQTTRTGLSRAVEVGAAATPSTGSSMELRPATPNWSIRHATRSRSRRSQDGNINAKWPDLNGPRQNMKGQPRPQLSGLEQPGTKGRTPRI